VCWAISVPPGGAVAESIREAESLRMGEAAVGTPHVVPMAGAGVTFRAERSGAAGAAPRTCCAP